MRRRPSFLAVLIAGAFLGSLIGRVLADAGVRLTLKESDEEAVDTALLGKQSGPATQNVYLHMSATISNMPDNVFVRNPDLWIGTNIDLTAIAAYNSGSATKFEITAVSPIHCLGAAHAPAAIGTIFNFVGPDNTTVTRTVVASANPVDDIEVYLLNQKLPPSITPLRVLPPDWAAYLPPAVELDLPAVFINQGNQLFCAEAAGIRPGPNPLVVYRPPSTRMRAAFNTQIISGDSSFPEIVLVHGVPALLSTWHFGGYGAGPLIAAHEDAINTAMRQLSTKFGTAAPYQLQPVDLTGIEKSR